MAKPYAITTDIAGLGAGDRPEAVLLSFSDSGAEAWNHSTNAWDAAPADLFNSANYYLELDALASNQGVYHKVWSDVTGTKDNAQFVYRNSMGIIGYSGKFSIVSGELSDLSSTSAPLSLSSQIGGIKLSTLLYNAWAALCGKRTQVSATVDRFFGPDGGSSHDNTFDSQTRTTFTQNVSDP